MIIMDNEILKEILGKLDLLTKAQQEMKQEQQEMKFEQQEMKREQKEMKFEQQQIKQAVMETNESVKRLESIQNSQHRIIELLSTRSIEQEAEIKRIK